MPTLNKEIWLPEIMEGFYADDSFLKESRDMSAFVENNKINLAEAGVMPNVLINNTTYPVPMAERGDTPLEIELDYFDTENTVVRNAEKAELVYDKLASVTYGHKQALKQYFLKKAAHAWAPSAQGVYTPVLSTTGADDGTGHKKMTFEDLLRFEAEFDELEMDPSTRNICLSVKHLSHLRDQDMKLYKDIIKEKQLFSFKLHRLATKNLATFNSTTGVKKAYGAAVAGTDTISSLAWHKDEVMRADGDLDMFSALKDPAARGDIIGFQKRGIALPMRNKGIGSIYSAKI